METLKTNNIYSLAFFRFLFGLLLSIALVRFISRGWITDFYLKPGFFFSYYGFEWATPPPDPYLHLIYYALLLLAVLIMLGLFFRVAIVLFFFLFTYAELWDKTVYLNHYYLISLLSFVMSFLPMNKVAALDCLFRNREQYLPRLAFEASFLLKLQVGSVYFFGGIAKIGYDWLILGQPLRIWLTANSHFPVIGPVLALPQVALAASWLAMFFDLSAPFLLYFSKTRPWIYPVIILFHVFTALMFPIGMFPWFMCIFTLIFFSAEGHRKVMTFLFRRPAFHPELHALPSSRPGIAVYVLAALFFIQVLMPLRAWLYPGNPLWHEQGFRLSWRIMLMEKNGSLEYVVRVKETGREFMVKPSEFLTPRQVYQMSFQPDMILQFAHYLHTHYLESGVGDTEIRANCYVSLNGRSSRLLVDPETDLATRKAGWNSKEWITESP